MNKNETDTTTKPSNINISKLSDYEISRWAALQEAMEIIGDKCDERNIDFETVELKPLEILKYVDNASDVIYYQNFKSSPINISKTYKNKP